MNPEDLRTLNPRTRLVASGLAGEPDTVEKIVDAIATVVALQFAGFM